MAEKLGRNDPCWCGSGKKYKRCHMREDREKRRIERAQPASVYAPPDPAVAAADEAWERFKEADLEGKVALFLERLEERRLDEEDAYEMLTSIREESDPKHDPAARARFAELIKRLRRELPDVYRHDQAFYLEDLVEDAVADEQWRALPELLMGFAQVAEDHIDTFSRIIDMMLYHGQTRPLFDAMDAAWEDVSQSDQILAWGIDEFGGVLIDLAFYHYLETAASPHVGDADLVEKLKRYGEPREEWFEGAVRRLLAPEPSAWRSEDFGETVDAEQWEDNVQALLLEFVADRRRAGVPLSRGELAQGRLWQVLHQQFVESPLEPRTRSRRRRLDRGREARASRSPLVLTRQILDRTLASDFDFLGSRPYRAGALIELVPAYLHFLARLGLIHPTEMDQALGQLQALGAQVIPVLESYGADVHLVQAVQSAWSDEALDALCQDPALEAARAEPPVAAPAPLPIRAKPETLTFQVVYRWQTDAQFTIEMRGDQTLDDLHYAILDAADFDYDHLYSFYMSGRAWDKATEYSLGSDARHTSRAQLRDLGLRMKQRFLYLYDYGDAHQFDVQLVATSTDPPSGHHPKILEQHGEMPPQYRSWDDEEEWDEDEDWEEDEEESEEEDLDESG